MNFNHLKEDTFNMYLSGELSAQERHAADSHLTVCPACAGKLEEHRKFLEQLTETFREEKETLRLSSRDRIVIHNAVKEKMTLPCDSGTDWNRRVRNGLLLQLFAVLLTLLLLGLAFFLPARKEIQVPAVEPQTPVPAPVQDIKEPEALPKETETLPLPETKEPETAAVPEPKEPEATPRRNSWNRDLGKVLDLDNVDIFQNQVVNEGFQVSRFCFESPFAKDNFIIAVYATDTKNPDSEISLQLASVANLEERHPAGQKNGITGIFVMPFGELKNSRTEVCIRHSLHEKEIRFPLSGMALQNIEDVPQEIRLEAAIRACADPALVMKKDIRKQIAVFLEENGSDDPAIAELITKLKKIK